MTNNWIWGNIITMDKEGEISEKKTQSFGKNGVPTPISPGRPAGVPNKATQKARDAIAAFVEGNAERLTGWLDRIAEDDPKEAFQCFMSVVEFHIPKLSRSTVSGDKENPITVTLDEKISRRLLAAIPSEKLEEIIIDAEFTQVGEEK